MAKQIHVLAMVNEDGHYELLGAYSEVEFAKNNGQIWVNHQAELGYGEPIELEWHHDSVAEVSGCTLFIDSTTLDEDVRA